MVDWTTTSHREGQAKLSDESRLAVLSPSVHVLVRHRPNARHHSRPDVHFLLLLLLPLLRILSNEEAAQHSTEQRTVRLLLPLDACAEQSDGDLVFRRACVIPSSSLSVDVDRSSKRSKCLSLSRERAKISLGGQCSSSEGYNRSSAKSLIQDRVEGRGLTWMSSSFLCTERTKEGRVFR